MQVYHLVGLLALVGVVTCGLSPPPFPFGYYCHLTDFCRARDTTANCNPSSGTCTCTPGGGYKGYNCQANDDAPSDVTDPSCRTCNADGTEYCNAASCFCKYYRLLLDCENNRVQADCGSDALTLTVYTHVDPFPGEILFMDATGYDPTTNMEYTLPVQSSCKLGVNPAIGLPSLIKSDMKYEGTNTDCPTTLKTVDGSVTTYWYFVKVRQIAGTVNVFDEVITIKCISAGDNDITTVVTSALGVEENPTINLHDFDTQPEGIIPVDVAVSVMIPGGTVVSIPVVLGTALVIKMELTPTAATSDFSVKNAHAKSYDPSGPEQADKPDFFMMENWCVYTAAKGVVTATSKNFLTKVVILINFVAFALDHSDLTANAVVYFVIGVCKGSCASLQESGGCTPDQYIDYSDFYKSTLATSRRRKRDSESLNATTGNVANYNARVSVIDPYQVLAMERALEKCNAGCDPCYSTLAVLLPMATISVLVVLVVAMSVFFYRKASTAEFGNK